MSNRVAARGLTPWYPKRSPWSGAIGKGQRRLDDSGARHTELRITAADLAARVAEREG